MEACPSPVRPPDHALQQLVASLRASALYAECGCNGIQEVVLRVLLGAQEEERFELLVGLCEVVGRRAAGHQLRCMADLVVSGDYANVVCFLGVHGAHEFLCAFFETRFRAFHAVRKDFDGAESLVLGGNHVVIVALALLNLVPDGASCEHRVVLVHDGGNSRGAASASWLAVHAFRVDAIGKVLLAVLVAVNLPAYLADLQIWCAFDGRTWDARSRCAEAYARLCLVPSSEMRAVLRADLHGLPFVPGVFSKRFVVPRDVMAGRILRFVSGDNTKTGTTSAGH